MTGGSIGDQARIKGKRKKKILYYGSYSTGMLLVYQATQIFRNDQRVLAEEKLIAASPY